jgi:hypothetical protein
LLTIRNDQLQVFREVKRREFEEFLFSGLASLHPQRPREWIRDQITRGVHQAMSFDIVLGADIYRFVSLKLSYGDALDRLLTQAEVQEKLTRQNIPAGSKLHFLWEASLRTERAE